MAKTENRNAVIYINGVEVNNTLGSIEKHARSLRNEIKHLTRGTDEYNAKVKELQATNKIINEHREKVSGVNKVWGEIKSQIRGAGAVLMAFLGGQAILNGFRNMIQRLGEIDDKLADVAKTTGLSRQELTKLDKELRTLNTRSSRTQLLDLAKEAGKLGYDSVADIKRFVEEADQINIALGEDLGEGAITQIGKLANIFKTNLLNIGSALNEVGAAGIASESWQVDYLSRLAGIAETANLSLPDLLGYGATLESMGQTAEVSGTALNQFFLEFIGNTEEFGRIAGFAEGELKTLIGEQGTNAGFVAFLEKLKQSSTGTEDLIQKLDAIGVDGARASNVLLTLANNTGEIAKQQEIANKAFQDGTSITEEFNRKQESFGATLARLQKWLAGVFLNNALAEGVRNMVTGITNMVSPIKTVNEQLEEERLRLNTLVLSITNHNTSQATRVAAIEELKKSYPQFIELVDIETASNEQLFTALNKVNAEYAKQILIQRKGQELADQAEKQADALDKVMELEDKYSNASARIKDLTGLIQRADETSAQFSKRVFDAMTQMANSSKGHSQAYLNLKKAYDDLNGATTALIPAQKSLNAENDKFNNLLNEQTVLKQKLLGGSDGPNGPDAKDAPAGWFGDPGDPNSGGNGKSLNDNLKEYNTNLKETGNIAEDIRQQVFLLTADESTKALYELDKFFEELIITATAAGLTENEIGKIYDIWTAKALELEEQLKQTTQAAVKMFAGVEGGGSKGLKTAAEQQRASTEEQVENTILLRQEQENYLNAIIKTGAAAIQNAQNEKEAIAGVLNAIREAIKQRIMEAIASAISSVLATLPFPVNIALGMVAGAGAAALFDKFVPQAADGGYFADVVGRQDGRSYRAQVNQRFMGGYATQPMLVGEAGAEYTIPSYLMRNPYVLNVVDQLEGMRKGQTNSEPVPSANSDLSPLYDLVRELIAVSKKNKYVIMPDQTIKKFQERQAELDKFSQKRVR